MNFALVEAKPKLNEEFLEKVANAAFSCFKETEGEIELKFVSIEEINDLNLTYRGIDKPTDVLSFMIAKKPLIGQIFICYNIAKEQAKKAGKSAEDEVALLLVHGILHIFDYDHCSAEEEKIMQKLETEILSKMGINR